MHLISLHKVLLTRFPFNQGQLRKRIAHNWQIPWTFQSHIPQKSYWDKCIFQLSIRNVLCLYSRNSILFPARVSVSHNAAAGNAKRGFMNYRCTSHTFTAIWSSMQWLWFCKLIKIAALLFLYHWVYFLSGNLLQKAYLHLIFPLHNFSQFRFHFAHE